MAATELAGEVVTSKVWLLSTNKHINYSGINVVC